MKKSVVTIVLISLSLLSGCAAAWQSVAYSDDLYSIHNKTAIAERQKAEAELAKAQYEAQQAQYEATIAKIKAEAAKQGVAITEGSVNGYDAVLADSYDSAYARRLYGFASPTYRMPSSYYTLRYSDAFHYASAYDPAFYNVMVSGDMVWVEPKYITSMFGTWGAVAVPTYGWYYGWNSPYYWGYPYGWNTSWYWGWNSPYYWSYPYYYHHHHHYPHHYPHKPPYHRPSHTPRPPYPGSGSVGNTGYYHNRPGMVVGRNPGASRPANGGVSARPSQPSQPTRPSSGRGGSTPSYRGGSSSSNSNGSSSYRGGSTPSYNSGSRGGSSYSGGGSYGGGGSHGSSSSHSSGNSRGR